MGFARFVRFARTAAAIILLLGAQAAIAADLAGKVVFVRGAAQAIDAGGASRNLSRGSEVYAGDRLVSGGGTLQVSFVDGAFMSIQPNSEFRIDAYKYSGKPDGTESAAYDLVKGGVRAVTGLIGKQHPDAFKVQTAVATIGIRGTGFNTRICAGDCPGLKDGLYHNTWEGTTVVFNNVDSRDVPTGSGVFVPNINAPIEILAQPPAATAVDTGSKQQEKQRATQDTSTIVASGDQRSSEGIQTDISGGTPGGGGGGTVEVLGSLVAEHINQSDVVGVIDANGLENLSVFLNSGGEPIGALFSEEHDCNPTCTLRRSFATVDLSTMLLGNDPAAVGEVQSLLSGGDQGIIAQAQGNFAHVADFFTDGNVGWFRWTGGDVLVVEANGNTNLNPLIGNQSIHIIFGEATNFTSLPTGSAVYTFMGGTQSTSLSGATIGQGVTSGTIAISDFSSGQAALSMTVSHVNTYDVAGLLSISADGGIQDMNVVATTGSPVAGSACYPSCSAFVDGGFAGPLSSGKPTYAGIAYSISETDPIIGVAAFKGP